ncbi:MAG: hypothetical protein J6S58_05075, partial [Lentisphaeria bacterium]|nr:hypothetical protein [Lentisphaeria bacterium]
YGIGPFYFKAEGKVPAGDMYAVFRTLDGDKVLYSKRLPLEILQIKEVPVLKHINVGPAFFFERYLITWPEFFKSMRAIGFNTMRFDYLSPQSEERYANFYREGVKNGFRFRGQMSCAACVELYAARDKVDVKSLYCYGADGKPVSRRMCPSYRGKYFLKVLDILRTNSLKYPMEFISFDEEAWCHYRSGDAFTKCVRCDAFRKSKNMTWKDFVPWVQADYNSEFYKAVKHGKKTPTVGYYNVHPGHIIGNSTVGPVPFNGFNLLYPKYCDELQPSIYSPNTPLVHLSVRNAFDYVQYRPEKVQVWLSAGVGAYAANEYGRHSMYQVLEALMNGATGIQYYYYQSFVSPRDYAYVAEALRLVAPYEDIFMKGSMPAFAGSNKALLYTARTYKNRTLVLVGNYGSFRSAATVLPIKGKVTDLENGRKYTANGSFRCSIPADSCRFFLVEK